MVRVALLVLIVAALFATLHAAPEPGSAGAILFMCSSIHSPQIARFPGTRAPSASSQAGAASQKAKQAAADKPQSAPASASASAPAPAPAPAPAVSNYTPVSRYQTSSHQLHSLIRSMHSHVGLQLAAGTTDFSLMQQIRGNLNGFECDVATPLLHSRLL
jgi:hypothetical protein